MTKIEIANTIIEQLGGKARLNAMISARNFIALESGLQFNFSGSRKYNRCQIILNGSDLYDLKFFKIPILNASASTEAVNRYFEKKEKSKEPVAEYNGVFCDTLVEIFEQETGLFLHF